MKNYYSRMVTASLCLFLFACQPSMKSANEMYLQSSLKLNYDEWIESLEEKFGERIQHSDQNGLSTTIFPYSKSWESALDIVAPELIDHGFKAEVLDLDDLLEELEKPRPKLPVKPQIPRAPVDYFKTKGFLHKNGDRVNLYHVYYPPDSKAPFPVIIIYYITKPLVVK